MKIKHQLFFISLLTLLIPFIGYQFIKELEKALQHNRLQQLTFQAQHLAKKLKPYVETISRPTLSTDSAPAIYALSLDSPIILDGYFDDWRVLNTALQPLQSATSETGANIIDKIPELKYLAAQNQQQLYLFIDISDLNYHYRTFINGNLTQSLTQGDYLVLRMKGQSGNTKEYIINPFSPGISSLWQETKNNQFLPVTDIKSAWQDRPGGIQVELSIPLFYASNGIGFSYVKSRPFPLRPIWQGNLLPNRSQPLPPLIYRQSSINRILASEEQPYTRLSLIGPKNWVWGQSGLLETPSEKSTPKHDWGWVEQLLVTLIRYIGFSQPKQSLNNSQIPGKISSATIHKARATGQGMAWVRDKPYNRVIMVAAAALPFPYEKWVIEVAQTTDTIASLTSHAMLRLLSTSFMVVAILILVLLGFAGRLSWRILQLKRQIESSVSARQHIHYRFTPSDNPDELGELSRSYYQLLNELHHYTDYLEQFSQKLSHELRTPLAIVSSSLSNLELDLKTDSQPLYLQRARQGCNRLSKILQAMTEASRLEQSISHHEMITFDLADVVQQVGAAHQSLLKETILSVTRPTNPCSMVGSPDLIAQLLDKLLDNAADFTPPNGKISLALTVQDLSFKITLCNEGSSLPRHLEGEIFKAFVSFRDNSEQAGHMGQGLVIVRLIAQYHQGQVRAYNRKDGKGVCFTVTLPYESLSVM